ncbi:MgtC/SapB family protein [Humitalea sp. 24SJ18S-53]|uniref:MgtC/SapB family protein n=1 Tax=Humitalea sp. 24SJ18S-53 TaxID=3422307 RepID=UPI003D67CE89
MIVQYFLTDGTIPLLLLAFLCGALIGLEREFFSHSCGIRPCVLVAIGAAAFGDLTVTRIPDANWGNAFGAVVTGVGFLGAGAILKQDALHNVRGLSTAATIWVVAIIGLLVGAREVLGGLTLTVLVLLVNVLLRPLARHLARRIPPPAEAATDRVMEG